MTALSGKRLGSGFISRNNDDPTAEATYNFMVEAGVPRKATVTWNVVPGWNGTRKISGSELREGVECVKHLIDLLPKIRAVMFVGRKARSALKLLEATGLALFSSDHPSPLVKARYPDRWKAIGASWSKLREYCSDLD